MRRFTAAAVLAASLAMSSPGPAAAQWVGFDPSEVVPATESFTFALALDTQGVAVLGVDVQFSFDPAIVQVDSVTVGDWFTTAPQSWFFWCDAAETVADVVHVTGTVMTTGRAGAGALAFVHMTALAAGFSPLEFLNLDLRNSLNMPVPHTASSGDRVIVEDAVPAAALSFGSLKARLR